MFGVLGGITVDSSGNLFIVDTSGSRIRKLAGGMVSTLAGGSGQFTFPSDITIDKTGNLYVTDSLDNMIVKVTQAAVITTLAGSNGNAGYVFGLATSSLVGAPKGIVIDSTNNIYFVDANRINIIMQ